MMRLYVGRYYYFESTKCELYSRGKSVPRRRYVLVEWPHIDVLLIWLRLYTRLIFPNCQ